MTVGAAALLYAVTGAMLVALGLHGVVALPHPLRKLVALNFLGSGIFLVLVAGGARSPGPLADPVPHAMVLTGLVVAVSATALALVLILRLESHPAQRTQADDEGPAS